jgi:putative spermidine/putrescine transport system permease protein
MVELTITAGGRVRQSPRLREASEALAGPRALRAAVLVATALYGVVPLIATVLYSFATVWRRNPLPDGYTLQWWLKTLQNPWFLAALGRSLALALLSVLIINLLVLPPLYWAHVRNPRIRPFLQASALIPFVLPGVVMASGIHRFVGLWPWTAPFQASPELLLLAMVAVSFPPYLWAVDGAMRTIGIRTLAEAAETLGAGPRMTLLRVIVPGIRHGIAAGSLLVFASTMGELALARILTGSAFETLPLWQLRQLHGTDADPNAMAVSSVLSLIMLFGFSFVIVFRGGGKGVPMAVGSGQRAG